MDNTVALDLGSDTLKAGYAANLPSNDEPRVVTPCCVEVRGSNAALPNGGTAGASSSDLEGAEAAAQLRRHPVRQGQIEDFDGVEALLHYVLYELLGWPRGDEGSVIVSEPLFTSRASREQLTQLLFETFNASGAFFQDQAVAALSTAARQTGVVVDVGHGKVDVSCVVDGSTYLPGAQRLGVAGQDLDKHLQSLLPAGTPALAPGALRSLKEQCCRVEASLEDFEALISGRSGARSAEPDANSTPAADGNGGNSDTHEAAPAHAAAAPTTYTLPDGQQISLPHSAGASVGEALLRPAAVMGHSCPGLAEVTAGVVSAYPDAAVRRGLSEGIFVCGGGACIPGLDARLVHDLKLELPASQTAALLMLPEYLPANTQRFAPWVGCALLAKVVAAQGQMMTKAEYDEAGPAAIHRKCS